MKEPNRQETGSDSGAHSGGASRERIGLIGVGLLGAALAERLVAAGYGVVGFDLDAGCLDRLEALGGERAGSALGVIAGCRRIVLSLPNSEIVRAVLQQIKGGLRPGQILIDTTTGDPRAAEASGRMLEALGVSYLDAAVCGSSEELRRGGVLVVAGGPADTYEACQDLFAAFARRSWRMGEWGAGLRMKLTSNLVLGLNRAALAEALAFAEALGVASDLALAVLREGSSYSRIMDFKGRKMLDRDFVPQARLSQHLKDVRLMLAAGAETGAKLPLSEQHCLLLEQAEAAGLGNLDNSAIIEVLRKK